MLDIYVDGDACPVKSEVYRVALRHDLKVYVVSDGALRAQAPGRVEFIRVRQGYNAADDWIAERAQAGDIAITTDIPLADRCLKKGARVVAPQRPGVYRGFDRRGVGQARVDGPPASDGVGYRRSTSVRSRRPFALPCPSRRGDSGDSTPQGSSSRKPARMIA